MKLLHQHTHIALEVREDSLVESPADPKLEPPIDPRVKLMMVQARTNADP
jgi:hypothetical protein